MCNILYLYQLPHIVFFSFRYLKYAISDYHDKRIRKQDSTSVFGAVYSSITGAECILDFVDKHYKDMEK